MHQGDAQGENKTALEQRNQMEITMPCGKSEQNGETAMSQTPRLFSIRYVGETERRK